MKYIFEKGITMPLCAIQDDIYFDYLTGQVIDNKNIIDFLKKGLKCGFMTKKNFDLQIYEIIDTENYKTVGYNYKINGISNYLETNKNPFDKNIKNFIVDKLSSGEYMEGLIWG